MKIPGSFRTPPTALTIAGSDNSAGAGIQADLKTFSHFEVYGLTALTCVVAEVPGRVAAIQAVQNSLVEAQIVLSLEHFGVAAIKTGMLYAVEIIETVVQILAKRGAGIPLVVDPVMVATSGDALLKKEAVTAICQYLLPLATLVTPNLDEAAVLSGQRKISTIAEMETIGKALSAQYDTAFLMKGGHLPGGSAIDILIQGNELWRYESPFIEGVTTHGTGCTYSAAITANLALGLALPEAVGRAKLYISEAIRQSFRWNNTMALNHFAQLPC
jgi:hydroxymethylpyrimidine/phosphomethylpyrimidine kinase